MEEILSIDTLYPKDIGVQSSQNLSGLANIGT